MEIAQPSFLQKLHTEIEARRLAEEEKQQQEKQHLSCDEGGGLKPLQNPGNACAAEQRGGDTRKQKLAPLRLMWRGGKKVRREAFELPSGILRCLETNFIFCTSVSLWHPVVTLLSIFPASTYSPGIDCCRFERIANSLC